MTKLPKDIRSALSVNSSMIDRKFKQQLKNTLLSGGTMSKAQPKVSFFSHKYFVPLAGASLVLASVVGIGSFMYSANRSENASIRAVELPSDLSDVKSIDEIRSLATIGLIGGVNVSSVELEQEEGQLVYKVRYSDGTFKLFNARTGEMVAKSDLEVGSTVPLDFVAGVTIDSARQAAQGVYPNKVITKIELELEEGIVVYSVRFSDDSRVDVSATDGSVVRVRDGISNSNDSSDDSNEDSDDSQDSDDHEEEDTEDDGDRSGSNSGSGSSNDDSGRDHSEDD